MVTVASQQPAHLVGDEALLDEAQLTQAYGVFWRRSQGFGSSGIRMECPYNNRRVNRRCD